MKLRKLMIIPTYDSPHKDTALISYEHRAEMCRMAFSGISEKCEVEISDIEQKMGGVSYTINTLRELKRIYPERRFFLLIGGDMLYTFREWFRYESILKECKVCAVARGGDNYTDMLEFATELGYVKVLPTGIVDVSSTEIREKTAQGGDISKMVPESVARYISENNLWR